LRNVILRLTGLAAISALGLTIALGVLGTQAVAMWGAGAADDADFDLDPLAQRSVVYARDGSVLAVLHAEENRAPVPLEEIPPHVVRVILAVEDEHFFEHRGVNLRATLRALVSNVSAGEVLQGGSTVTQQVVKNSLLTPEKHLDRKVREAALAWRLERTQSKEEILERYLNTVYFGNGAYGVQAAAETYYGLQVDELTVGQAALLAAIIRNPVGYDPVRAPELAAERRALVLRRLEEVGYITPDEAAAYNVEPVPASRFEVLPTPDDYFVEAVKQALLGDKRLGDTPQDRFHSVFRGGLQVHTTLDPRQQDAAERAVDEALPDTDEKFTAALVSLDPGTGAVRALVGGPGFERAKYNLATQGRRQPGSAFKPFVLAAALEEGISPRDTIDGTGPCSFRIPGMEERWRPENYGNSRGSVTTVEKATARSYNCAYARLGLIVGPDDVVETARALGVKGPLEPVAAISLGTEEVTPLEMAGAYATFANDGVHHEPYFIERVVHRDGDELFSNGSDGERVLSQNTARLVTDVLQEVVRNGTGTAARLPRQVVAGKTGTAQDHGNAWFVGYTPRHVAAVWMGAPEGNVPMRNVGGIRVTGGTYPARIWRAFMSETLEGEDPKAFAEPDWSELGRSTYLRVPREYASSSSRPRTTSRRPRPPAAVVTVPTTVAPPPDGDSGGTYPADTDPGAGPPSGGGGGSPPEGDTSSPVVDSG
jgi:penicillin-binding protein 1A